MVDSRKNPGKKDNVCKMRFVTEEETNESSLLDGTGLHATSGLSKGIVAACITQRDDTKNKMLSSPSSSCSY